MRKLREMWATCMEVGQLGAKVSGSSTTHIFTLKKVVALVCVLHNCLPYCKHLGVVVTVMFESRFSYMLYQLFTCQLKFTCMWF